MSEKPILFSGGMVRAILSGAKSQTRRVLKTPKGCPKDYVYTPGALVDPAMGWWQNPEYDRVGWTSTLPYSQGDRLWVRERAAVRYQSEHHIDGHRHSVSYAADEDGQGGYIAKHSCGSGIRKGKAPTVFPNRSHNADGSLRWASSIHMPRWASRITLSVTAVRVERLQDITEADAIAEGAPSDCPIDYIPAYTRAPHSYCFAQIWESINGPGAWEANPFVVAVTFRRVALADEGDAVE